MITGRLGKQDEDDRWRGRVRRLVIGGHAARGGWYSDPLEREDCLT